MAEKQKPDPGVVEVAARVLKDPDSLTKADGQKMAARIMDDQRNDPDPHRVPTPAAEARSGPQVGKAAQLGRKIDDLAGEAGAAKPAPKRAGAPKPVAAPKPKGSGKKG